MRPITRCPCGTRIRHYADLCKQCDAAHADSMRAWFQGFNSALKARAEEGRPITLPTYRSSTPEPVLSGDTELWCVVGRPGDTESFALSGDDFARMGALLGLPPVPARVARNAQHTGA